MGKASRKRRERMEQVQKAREIEGLVKRARFYDQVDFRNNPAELIIDAQNVYDRLIESFRNGNEHDDAPALNQCYMDWIGGESFAEDIVGRIVDPQLLIPPVDRCWIEYKSLPSWVHDGFGNHPFVHNTPFRVGIELKARTDFEITYPTVYGEVYRDGDPFSIVPVGTFQYDYAYSLEEWLSKLDHFQLDTLLGEGSAYTLTQAAIVTLDVLQFLNCRNIVTVDHDPDPADNAAYQRHFGMPMTKYKTLAIKSAVKRYERDDKPQEQFDVMPLHLVRGHFMTHTPERPRFGKPHPSNIGTIFVPAHARGDARNGIRVKDYEVKTDAQAYDEMANTAAFYLDHIQQKSAEAFAAMKGESTDE